MEWNIIETQDDIDYAVITGLGGRVSTTDAGLYEVISNLAEGDTFVIKDNINGEILFLGKYAFSK